MALLLCVRHGETDWNREQRWQGHADQDLNALGREQAAQAAEVLGRRGPAAIVSSDLRRSVATAEPLAARVGLRILQRPDLREVDVGSWVGLTREEALARDPSGVQRHESGLAGWTDGETYEVMMTRAVAAAEDLAARYPAEAEIAVFTHGGVIRALAAQAVGITAAEARRRLQHVAHASVTELRVPPPESPHPWRLVRFNHELVSGTMGPTDLA